jgi:hypothetical protein
LPKGASVWRAQVGSKGFKEKRDATDEPYVSHEPLPKRRMKPTRNHPSDGRVNVRGIPCLYVSYFSDDRTHRSAVKTAIAEVRPEVGAYLSVARLKLCRELRVIDASSDRVGFSESLKMWLDKQEKDPEVVTRWIWSQVNLAFSRPVAREDSALDYLPTQVIAEFFRHKGFDGIGYKSGLGPGSNLALFRLSDARVERCFVLEVTSVEYEFTCEGDITGQWPYD